MQYKGQYTDNLMYSPGDVVLFGSSSFVARKMTRGEQPSVSSPCWSMVAAGGQAGRVGDAGSNGRDGKDGAGVPVGGTVGQILTKTTERDHDTEWRTIDVSSLGAALASHKHSCSDIIDLPGMMDTKANAGHKHSASDIIGFSDALSRMSPAKHQHFGEDIIGGSIKATMVEADSVVVGTAIITDDMVSSSERLTLNVNGCDAISILREGTKIDNPLDVRQIRVFAPRVPATSSSLGVPGEMAWDDSFIYICVGKDIWKRSALSKW